MAVSLLRRLRLRLTSTRGVLAYSLVGIAAGFFTGLLIVGLRWVLTAMPAWWMPGADPENFEGLTPDLRFLLALGGAFLLGLLFAACKPSSREIGLLHVIDRMHRGDGQMPLRNALMQTVGAVAGLISGQSGGREGPAIHLGATASNYAGQLLRLPHNSLRVLAGCGSAAAIAASFNTPIAGVIFAMEVVMMEYTVAGFIPIMLSTVTATAVAQLALGTEGVFVAPQVAMNTLWDLPFVAVTGVIVGTLSAGFVLIQRICLRAIHWPVVLRFSIAGGVTGACAIAVPQVMGIGYDTLESVLQAPMAIQTLLLLIALKLLTSAITTGMGMPVGFIGPSMLLGALTGSLIGSIGTRLAPELASENAFYVVMGMGALMAAVLNAPLAALLAVVELTSNTDVILPAMLAIVAAQLTHRELFRQYSAPRAALKALNRDISTDPVSHALMAASAMAAMDRDVRLTEPVLTRGEAEELINGKHRWIVIEDSDGSHVIHPGDTLRGNVRTLLDDPDLTELNLYNSGPTVAPCPELEIQGTLYEARQLMVSEGVDKILVAGELTFGGPFADIGVITRQAIETFYMTPGEF